MFQTFKQFLDEDGPGGTAAPSAGGPAAAPSAAGGTAATTNTGASQALISQSNNLGQQIQTMNTKMQALMRQKAAIDKQIGTANASTQSQNQSPPTAAQGAVASTVGGSAAPTA